MKFQSVAIIMLLGGSKAGSVKQKFIGISEQQIAQLENAPLVIPAERQGIAPAANVASKQSVTQAG